MNYFKLLSTLLLATTLTLALSAQNEEPVPYPDVNTEGDTKKVKTKGKTSSSSSSSSTGDEAGTLKDVVSTNTGGASFPVIGAPDVKFEGKNVVRTSNYSSSNSSADDPNHTIFILDCKSFPDHCKDMVKAELNMAQADNEEGYTMEIDADSMKEASQEHYLDFEKSVEADSGFWVQLRPGEWIRIDNNAEALKILMDYLNKG